MILRMVVLSLIRMAVIIKERSLNVVSFEKYEADAVKIAEELIK